MATLDQTARFALKMAPQEAVRWLLPKLDADLVFARWLDTETIAFPGEPGRRCDTVAELVSRSGQSPPWAVVLEVEARPRSTIVARLLEYLGRLMRKLRHGPHRRDTYPVAGVVIFLTGRRKKVGVKNRLPGTKLGMSWSPGVRSMARLRAAAILERLDHGKLGRVVLPWVPLMAGAGEAAVIREWVRLARQEPSSQRRADYAGLALVFAERAGCLPAWKQALEGWEMWESQVVREWQEDARNKAIVEGRLAGLHEGREEGLREGRQEGLRDGQREGQRTALLKVLRGRFQTQVPEDLAQAIQQATDPEVLSRWLDAALAAPSLDAFRSLVQAAPGSPPG